MSIKTLSPILKPLVRKATIGSTIAMLSFAANANKIDLDSDTAYVEVNRKLQCSLKDNEETTFSFWGNAYARIPGQRDTKLFSLMGMNVRKCVTIADSKKGDGYRLLSREIMLYLDAETGEVLREWKNPLTDEVVDVIHVANDPVNSRPTFNVDNKGKKRNVPAEFLDGTYFMSFEIPLFYHNPLGGEYQKQIGGTYHSAEIFDFSGNTESLLSLESDIEYGNIAWVRIAKWLPWMNMGDRSGLMYFNAVGKKLRSWDGLPDTMKTEIRENYPEYTNAPEAGDTRPNETSWTYMKKIIDKRRANSKK